MKSIPTARAKLATSLVFVLTIAAGCGGSATASSSESEGLRYGTLSAERRDPDEMHDIVLVCSRMGACFTDRTCRGEGEAAWFGDMEMRTSLGENVQGGLVQWGFKRAGPAFAELLVAEGLEWSHPACRQVVKYFRY